MKIDIRKELIIVIKQANCYIDYVNGEADYNQFGDRFLRLANGSDLKQDFNQLKKWLVSKQNSDTDDFLQLILDLDGILKAITRQEKVALTNEQYSGWKQYWDELQNDLKLTTNSNYLK